MSVRVLTGDMFESKAQTLVNTVNCVGVMGKGIALEFKCRFPEMHEDYVGRCKHKKVRLGRPYLFKSLTGQWVLNFPTKDHWRSVSRLSDIIRGVEYLQAHCKEWGITSLAVPPLGCGHGGLDWPIVGRALYQHLTKLDIPVKLYAPHGTPREQLQLDFLARGAERAEDNASELPTHIRAAWIALVEILHRIEDEDFKRHA